MTSAAPSAISPRRPAGTFISCSKTTTTPQTCWTPKQDPPRGSYRAQWNDDYHHAWHVLLTGETQGYYRDFAASPLPGIARALASGFIYQGEASAHRGGQLRGEPSGTLAPTAFVNFLQNHDQIGNRAARRPAREQCRPAARSRPRWRLPCWRLHIPMLFMGEEWGSKAPFPFFCDFQGELADAVRQGRRREYRLAPMRNMATRFPIRFTLSTFRSAVLDWDARNQPAGRRRLALVQDLLAHTPARNRSAAGGRNASAMRMRRITAC